MNTYICIDLKSFYASVECQYRHLDPLKTNLVVADTTRTEKTICLAVSPSLKKYGLKGRARLFEVIEKVKEINALRKKQAAVKVFSGKSYDEDELEKHPDYELDFIAATPQMAKYIDVSTSIYEVYLNYADAKDIHVYSIDEVFIDITHYLKALGLTAKQVAKRMIQDIYQKTGITATAGIGTNLYLAKVAMDIMAKKTNPDEDGVRIAYLDTYEYQKQLWNHTPITDFWRVGEGYAKRLSKYDLLTMGDIAKCSVGDVNSFYNEDLLYKEFGVNAELLIDHAWGYEPCTMEDIKSYVPQTTCLTTGQVIHCPYGFKEAKLVVKEMVDQLALDLVDKGLVTDQLVLTIGYDIDNLKDPNIKSKYHGEIVKDRVGRDIPKGCHASISLGKYTSSTEELVTAISKLYDEIVNPLLLVRRVNIGANHTKPVTNLKKQDGYLQLNLFTDYEAKEKEDEALDKRREKEKNAQKAILELKKRFGKNAVLKGMNLEDGATMKERNKQIGGHKA